MVIGRVVLPGSCLRFCELCAPSLIRTVLLFRVLLRNPAHVAGTGGPRPDRRPACGIRRSPSRCCMRQSAFVLVASGCTTLIGWHCTS